MPRGRGATAQGDLEPLLRPDDSFVGRPATLGSEREPAAHLGLGGTGYDPPSGDDIYRPPSGVSREREMTQSVASSDVGRSRSVTGESDATVVTLAKGSKRDSGYSDESSLFGDETDGKPRSRNDCYYGTRRLFLSCVRRIPLSPAKRRFMWRFSVMLVLMLIIVIPTFFAVRALTAAPPSLTIFGVGSGFADNLYQTWFHDFQEIGDNSSALPTSSSTSFRFSYFETSPKEALSDLSSATEGSPFFLGIDYPGNATSQFQPFGLLNMNLYGFPTVASTLGIVYNKECTDGTHTFRLPDNIVLTPHALNQIFNGSLSLWNSQLIKDANKGLVLPECQINAAHFTASSGSTFVLTATLSKMDVNWENTYGVGFSLSNWNLYSQGTRQISTVPGMVSYLEGKPGGVGYVIYDSFVAGRSAVSNTTSVCVAKIMNGMKQAIGPTLDSLQKVVDYADDAENPEDLRPNLINRNCSGCYPFSAFTYILLDKNTEGEYCRYYLRGFHNFWEWAFTSDTAENQANSDYMVLLPKTHHEVVLSAMLSSLQCDDLTLVEWSYPSHNPPWWALVCGIELFLGIIALVVWQVVAHRRAKHKALEVQREIRKRGQTDGAGDSRFSVNQINARADLMRSQIGQDELTLLKQIGSGAFGEVYLGRFRGTKVAIKRQLCGDNKGNAASGRQDEKFEEFLAEASLLARLRHPNVVQFLGATMKPPHLYIVTDFCSRGALSSVLFDQDRSLSPSLRLKFSTDTAQGMNYLHTHSPPIVHRDLKTQNLLVTSNWDIKVADFGISRVVDETRTMTYCGTVHICAPEVIANQRYTEKADIFSYAVVLWEIWTRSDIWPAMTMFQIMEAVVDRDTRPPIDNIVASLSDAKTKRTRRDRSSSGVGPRDDPVPRQIDELIQRCWLRDADRRPNFDEILHDLRVIRKKNPSSSSSSPRPPIVPPAESEAGAADALAKLLAEARALP